SLENFSRGGRTILHALQPLTTVAFRSKPDLVIVSYGINDAIAGMPLATYRMFVQNVVDVVRAQGADLMLCGPSLILNEPPERGMALTRPYAATMREVAESNGVFFADLGDLSWLVQIVERPEPLQHAKKPSPRAPEAPSGPVSPAVPAIVSPVAEQMNPDPDKQAMEAFQQVVDTLKLQFKHQGMVDWVHPDTASHRVLGRRVFKELLNGPRGVPWQVSGASFHLEGEDRAVLAYRIENPTPDEQTYSILPLVTPMWKPLDASSRIRLKAGKKTQITVTYGRAAAAEPGDLGRVDLFASHEPFVRLPVLTVGGGTTRVEDLRAIITPVALLWDAGTLFNSERSVALGARLINTGATALGGTWEAEWLGVKSNGSFQVGARGETPLLVTLRPPVGTEATRFKGTLAVRLTLGGVVLRFEREVEMVRNIGLKETVPLFEASTYVRDKVVAPPIAGETNPGVSFRADADSSALYLTYDIYGYNLQDNPDGSGALSLGLNLDGRSYGKRLTPGATDDLRVTAGAGDGDATVASLPAWCFGTGYANEFDAAQVKAKVTSRPDGARRLTLTIPRAFLYLHEWALGNGNSQLGLNTMLQLWQPGESKDSSSAKVSFAMFLNGRHRDDAEALAVLELTDKPTSRWTVHVY
ncbi:MAG: SGNH/GDSL hydrolase family protein, partial [Roseimicrobium sp.]